MLTGTNNSTGNPLDGLDHLKQSIVDILTTPIGTRVMRREYGSKLFELIDAPINGSTVIDLVSATAEALYKWEPRIKIERIVVDNVANDGKIELTLEGKYLPDGKQIRLDGIIL